MTSLLVLGLSMQNGAGLAIAPGMQVADVQDVFVGFRSACFSMPVGTRNRSVAAPCSAKPLGVEGSMIMGSPVQANINSDTVQHGMRGKDTRVHLPQDLIWACLHDPGGLAWLPLARNGQ